MAMHTDVSSILLDYQRFARSVKLFTGRAGVAKKANVQYTVQVHFFFWCFMANLDPFGLNPSSGTVDYFTAYWYAALSQATYFSPSGTQFQLFNLAGATALIRLELPGLSIPYVDMALFPGSRAVSVVVGTRFFQEFVNQAFGAILVSAPEWPGLVASYWSGLALLLWAEILNVASANGVTSIAFAGHSQGGAIAQLLPQLCNDAPGLATACVCTFGCPRSGNVVFADSQTNNYLRVTNEGDPVHLLPAAVSTPLDQFLWLVPGINLNSYKHWGTRVHFSSEGQSAFAFELPTWATAYAALLETARATSSWFDSHYIASYARRIRRNIPGAMGAVNPDYPGLQDLDLFFQGQEVQPPATTWTDLEVCP